MLETRQQLQGLYWWRHEATKIEQHKIARGVNLAKVKMLEEGDYANLQEKNPI